MSEADGGENRPRMIANQSTYHGGIGIVVDPNPLCRSFTTSTSDVLVKPSIQAISTRWGWQAGT